MKLTLNDSLFDEIFQIICTNESKANSLRQSLLKNNNFDNNDELNMKIIQSLGEFEYDLKTLYRIIRDLKLSYNDIHNTLINSNNKKEEDDNKIKFDDINKYKKGKTYFDDFENILKEGNRTYFMSSSHVSHNNKNRCKNIKEYYIKSYNRPENARKFQRSMSCKSYIGNWNNNDKNNFNSFNNDNRIQNDLLLYNNSNYNDKLLDSNFSDKDNDLKLNFDYDSYLTDYSLNKTTKKDPNSPNNIISNSIIPKESLNLSDLKNENNYDVTSKYINNKIDNDNKINNNNGNENYLNQNNNVLDENKINNNNIFTFSDSKPGQNMDKDFNATFDPNNINVYQSDNNNIINKENNNEYLDNQNNNNKNMNNKYTYEDFINDKYNNNKYDNNNYDNNKYQLNDNENKEINNNNLNEEENNNNNINNNNINNNNEELNPNKKMNYNFDDNGDNKIVNNNNEENEENSEDRKKEKIKYIVSEIFQDPNTLDLLKRKLGDDIGEKLLSGNINEEELFKVVELLKKNKDYINNKNNSKKKTRRYFPKKKFNQPCDKVLLKELLKEKRYHYREFPRGWSSTKDFFVNNGSTFLKDRSMNIKKYYN